MQLELLDYQAEAVEKVAKLLVRSNRDYLDDHSDLAAVVLAAPTGAGKTVIATAVVEASLDGDESTPGVDDATFLWVTDDPSLNRQTVHKMMAASSALAPNRLITIENDFDEEVFQPGRVYFLNIQKLSSSANLSKSQTDGRTWSLWETIANTVKRRPQGFTVIIDEAHRGMGSASHGRAISRETIVSQIIGGGSTGRPPVPVVWGISATPKKFVNAMTELGRATRVHTIQLDDVRSSGLLKDQIVLGHTRGIDAAESTLVRHAVRRVRQYDARWGVYTLRFSEPPVSPALIIQVGDKTPLSEIEELIATVFDEWHDLRPHNIAHVFGDHAELKLTSHRISWCPPEDIQDRQEIKVVLCKTAITTGWDCPRAEVLLSLRVARDTELITQVMGRMVRTPLARTIANDEDLNTVHCILPKFDEAAVNTIADRFRAGDSESLSGGAEVVTHPVELSKNPSLFGLEDGKAENTVPGSGQAIPTPDSNDLELVSPEMTGATSEDEGLRNDFNRKAKTRAGGHTGAQPLRDDQEFRGTGLFAETDRQQEVRAIDAESVYALLSSLPSYTIPRRSYRSPVARLWNLAFLLSTDHDGRVIHANAANEARNQLLSVIDIHRENLASSGQLDILLEQARTTRLYEKTVAFGRPDRTPTDVATNIPLDSRGISLLMNRARAALPEGLANEYVKRLAPSDEDVTEAMLTVIAVAGDPVLREEIDLRSSQLLEEWFNKYGALVSRLAPANREKFDRIKRESDRPLVTSFSIPDRRVEDANGEWWPQHLLSDPAGEYRASFLEWEAHVLTTELKAGVVAWYRNPRAGQHALRIPYESSQGTTGMSPDFIFIDKIGDTVGASIVDPHGVHLSDALPKLQGLARYAVSHGESFNRIQSVARVGGIYFMLDLLDEDVRSSILNHTVPDASAIYLSCGLKY